MVVGKTVSHVSHGRHNHGYSSLALLTCSDLGYFFQQLCFIFYFFFTVLLTFFQEKEDDHPSNAKAKMSFRRWTPWDLSHAFLRQELRSTKVACHGHAVLFVTSLLRIMGVEIIEIIVHCVTFNSFREVKIWHCHSPGRGNTVYSSRGWVEEEKGTLFYYLLVSDEGTSAKTDIFDILK